MSLMFEVAEGGFLDIDVKINGPDGKEIYKGINEYISRRMLLLFPAEVERSSLSYVSPFASHQARENLTGNTLSPPTSTASTSIVSPTKCRR